MSRIFLSPWMHLLSPLSAVYGAAARRRRRRLAARAVSLEAPVVSVGNLTVGGTGKTPVVELVARELAGRGLRPAVLSRGYKPLGKNTAAGPAGERVNDEFLVLEENLPGLMQLQNPDRVEAGREALRQGAQVLILDDGFQHVRLHRDLDLVLIDATDPFGSGRLLPAGPLREPIEALGQANLFVLTRCRHTHAHKLAILRQHLRGRFPGIPQCEVDFQPEGWRAWRAIPAAGEPPAVMRGIRALAFCGIGNPEAFRRELVSLGVELVEWLAFPDHHGYTPRDLERLEERALAAGAEAVICTQKDAVKIPTAGWPRRTAAMKWRWLLLRPRMTTGGEHFQRLLDRALKKT